MKRKYNIVFMKFTKIILHGSRKAMHECMNAWMHDRKRSSSVSSRNSSSSVSSRSSSSSVSSRNSSSSVSSRTCNHAFMQSCSSNHAFMRSCSIINLVTYLFFFVFLLGTISVNSQTLEDYLEIAAENNPGLKSKFYLYQASLEKVPQVGALPDPDLTFGIFIKPMERYMGNQVADISIMQMFPWFGTLGAAEDEAAAMAKAKYEEFNEAKTMLFFEVKANLYALYLLQKEISITEENIEILQTLEEISINRLKSGRVEGAEGSSGSGKMPKDKSTGTSGSTSGNMSGMDQGQTSSGTASGSGKMESMDNSGMSGGSSMVDVLRVQIEINELKNNLALLNDSKQPLLAQFNKLLNRSGHLFVNIPDSLTAVSLPIPIADIPDNIRLNNPMLKMLQREDESHLAHEKMSRKMGFPMIGLGLQYSIFQQRPGNMMTAENMIMPMVNISLPIWRSKYDAAIREAEFLHHSTGLRKDEAANQLMVSYEDAIKDFKDAERRFELYKQQSILAQQALELITVSYTTAGTNFEEVLRMQQQLLDYTLRSLDAVVDQNIAVAMLERLMGR